MAQQLEKERQTKPEGDLPLVTVVVPVYNGERFLRQSLDSILAQTYPNIEVIVMDDASTDVTAEIIASYGLRVRSCRQTENRGIYGNMNDGIAMAQGDLIAVYHADDIYEPEIVRREVEFLRRHPEAGAVFCSDIFIDPDGGERGRLALPFEVRGERPLDYRAILNALLKYRNRFLRCPSCMVRTGVYRNVGVYRHEKFFNTSDLDMYLRISQRYPIGILEEHLFRYRWGHGNSGQRYRHMRTDPERFFAIMDLYLHEGGRAVATDESLTAYEAHRAEDNLMRVVNLYISDRLGEARDVLKSVKASQLLGSSQVQGRRLVVLLVLLRTLVRLKRVPIMATLFYRRWHA